MVVKNLPSDALASANSVTFVQKEQTTAANRREERLLCIGNASVTGLKPGDIYLASGNADDIGVSFGFGSPLHRMAKKLFPRNGKGSKVSTYFMPVDISNGSAHKVSINATGVSTVNKVVYFKLYDQQFEAGADVAGKVATNAQIEPHKDASGIALSIFENTRIPFTVKKGMDSAGILKALKNSLDEYPEIPFSCNLNSQSGTSAAIKGAASVNVTSLTENDYSIKISIDGASDETITIGQLTASSATDVLDLVNQKLKTAVLSATTASAQSTTFTMTSKTTGENSSIQILSPDEGADLMSALQMSGSSKGTNGNELILTSKVPGTSTQFEFEIVTSDDASLKHSDFGFEFFTNVVDEGAGEVKLDDLLKNVRKEYGITRVVSQFNDGNALDAMQEYFEAFRDGLVGIFTLCYTSQKYKENSTVLGTVDVSSLIDKGNLRRNDAVNVLVCGDYGKLRSLEWSERNQLLKAGISNLEPQMDGSYVVADLCTFYHPIEKSEPLYRFDRDVCVIGNMSHDLHNSMKTLRGLTVIGEKDYSTVDGTIKISDIRTFVCTRVDMWGQAGWVADVETVKKSVIVVQDDTNSNRFNINVSPLISNVVRITDTVNLCSFYRAS